MRGQTAESDEPAFRRAPVSQVPFTLLAGGNRRSPPDQPATSNDGCKHALELARSSDLNGLSATRNEPAIIGLFKTQSQTSLPLLTCSEQFSRQPNLHMIRTIYAVCAVFLIAHVFQIDPNRGGDRPNCETHTMQDLSGSIRPCQLEWLRGFWFLDLVNGLWNCDFPMHQPQACSFCCVDGPETCVSTQGNDR